MAQGKRGCLMDLGPGLGTGLTTGSEFYHSQPNWALKVGFFLLSNRCHWGVPGVCHFLLLYCGTSFDHYGHHAKKNCGGLSRSLYKFPGFFRRLLAKSLEPFQAGEAIPRGAVCQWRSRWRLIWTTLLYGWIRRSMTLSTKRQWKPSSKLGHCNRGFLKDLNWECAFEIGCCSDVTLKKILIYKHSEYLTKD